MNIDGTVCLLQTGIMAGPVVEISVLRIIQHETGEYYYVQCSFSGWGQFCKAFVVVCLFTLIN